MIVMNWLGKMVGLPEEFLHRKGGSGGGVIQVRGFSGLPTSRGTLLSDHRERVHPDQFAGRALASHQEGYVECDENLSMRGPDLLQAIKKDRELGFVPFWVRELSLSRVSTQITNWGNLLKSDPTRNPPGRN
jgi:histidine decarboxylase